MTKDAFKDEINLLCTFFKESWPTEALKEAWEQVKDFSDESLMKTHKRIYVEFQPRPLPAIGRIVAIIREEQGKINASRSPAEPKSRQEIDREFNDQFGHSRDKHVEFAQKLIAMTNDHTVSREKVFEGIEHMCKSFPGLGWEESRAAHIRKYNNPAHYQGQ